VRGPVTRPESCVGSEKSIPQNAFVNSSRLRGPDLPCWAAETGLSRAKRRFRGNLSEEGLIMNRRQFAARSVAAAAGAVLCHRQSYAAALFADRAPVRCPNR
jgi:hypothetical protein